MLTSPQTNKQHLITFSPQLYKGGKQKAEKLGLSFTEYIRFLLVSDIKQSVELETMPSLSEEEETHVKQSLTEHASGGYKKLKNKKDISNYLEAIYQSAK